MKREHLFDEDDPNPLLESSLEGSPIKKEARISSRIPTYGNSWDDGMMTKEVKQIKGLNFFQSRKLLKKV